MRRFFERTSTGWALVIPVAASPLRSGGTLLLELPPQGITRELLEHGDLGESWKRLLTCWPIAVPDWNREMYVWFTSLNYWRITGGWCLWPIWRLLVHGLHAWWVEEGHTYRSGEWVSPHRWRLRRELSRQRLRGRA